MTTEQQTLVETHVDLVRKTVTIMLRRHRLPAWIDRDRLESAAGLALVRAAQQFVPERGRFDAFAAQRMQWAILDDLRAEAPLTRGVYQKWKTGDDGWTPRLFYSLDELHEHGVELTAPTSPMSDVFFAARIEHALCQLSPRIEKIMRLHFIQDLLLSEIAERFDLSHGRVSQLKAKGLRQLRHLLGVPAVAAAPIGLQPATIGRRVRQYFRERGFGWATAVEVACALDVPRDKVTASLSAMVVDGKLERRRSTADVRRSPGPRRAGEARQAYRATAQLLLR